MNIKVMAHNVKVLFVRNFQEREDIRGQHDSEEKLNRIACRSERGRLRPISALLVTFFHEISHEIDDDTGHGTFTDEDPEQRDIKEGALEAYTEGLVQVLLGNKMLSKEWIAKFKKEVGEAK